MFLNLYNTGVIRGCGRQQMGAYVNLGAYYFVGTPVAITLTFLFKLRGKGLWIGLTAGSAVQATVLATVIIFTDWERQVLSSLIGFGYKFGILNTFSCQPIPSDQLNLVSYILCIVIAGQTGQGEDIP